jgi:hypothetical protein
VEIKVTVMVGVDDHVVELPDLFNGRRKARGPRCDPTRQP